MTHDLDHHPRGDQRGPFKPGDLLPDGEFSVDRWMHRLKKIHGDWDLTYRQRPEWKLTAKK